MTRLPVVPEEPDAPRELLERDEPEALRELPAPLLFDLLDPDADLLELPLTPPLPVPLLLCFGMLFPSGEKIMHSRARCVP